MWYSGQRVITRGGQRATLTHLDVSRGECIWYALHDGDALPRPCYPRYETLDEPQHWATYKRKRGRRRTAFDGPTLRT